MTENVPRERMQVRGRGFARLIRDGQFREWFVREIPPAPYDRRRGPSLVFMSDGIMRRVRRYPPDWFELSDVELYTLSTGR